MKRSPQMTRRRALAALGLGILTVPVLGACSSPHAVNDAASGNPDTNVGGDNCGPAAAAWASGGTAAMTAKACYPDPFTATVSSCVLVMCQTTAGPCTAAAPVRVDVSEGYPGLPVRLALKFVTAQTCAPLAGAVIEIWHTQVTGVYSGVTPNPQMCSGGDADAPSHGYMRGTQTTDAAGVVTFDTCFPGWYSGRAIHIHFSVTVGGTSQVISQLFFDQTLIQQIFAAHPDYAPHGQPNTSNTSDNIYGGAQYLLDTARMSDGAMLASKVIAVHGAGQTNCSA